MKIEVWQSKKAIGKAKAGAWYWHFIARNGQIVSDAEPFASFANAARAAKAVVKAVIKPLGRTRTVGHIVFETWLPGSRKGMKPGVTEIRWS